MQWMGDNFVRLVEQQARANALRCAEFIADLAWDRVGIQWPRASYVTEYPRRRTGNLQRNIRAIPGDAGDIDEEFSAFVVSSAVSEKGFHYPTFLELYRGRLGLVSAMYESLDAISRIAAQSDIIDGGAV